MIKCFLTEEGTTYTVDEPKKDSMICLTHPTEKEVNAVAEQFKIDIDDLKAALDEEETARVSIEDDYTLIIIDIPSNEERNGKNRFVTIPLGIIITKNNVITVCLEKTNVLDLFGSKKTPVDTHMKSRLILQILFNNAQLYLRDLRSINKQSEDLEVILHNSIENNALLEMMELGRSLLYFSTSLKANSAVLDKLLKMPSFKKYEEDEELLEDVIVENKQAAEMAEIYNGVINGTMDAYASIISNNMNVVQKFIAIASIVISIPSIIFDAYGMNLYNGSVPFASSPHAFIIIILLASLAVVATIQYFKHKRMY